MGQDDDVRTPGPEHPEVVRRVAYEDIWPAGKPFPLTPLEAWYLLQGWEVAPAAGLTTEQFWDIPAKIEGGDGWLVLWRT